MSTRVVRAEEMQALHWPSAHALLIGSGEGAARMANLVLLVFVSRKFGVRALGAYALAQGISLYLMQGTDLGLRHIGARLVAESRTDLPATVRAVQRKRMLLAIVMTLLGYVYGRVGPVPEDTRSLVSLYALSVFGYAFSLDWLAWGMQRFGWLSGWRASVSVMGCAISIIAVEALHAPATIIALANGIAYATAAWLLWILWGERVMRERPATRNAVQPAQGTGWKSVAWLGLALLANQALGSADLILLGGFRSSTEAGFYSAAYRLLLLVTVIYYFATQAIYPQLAALAPAQRKLHMLWPYLWKIGLAGAVVTSVAELLRGPLVRTLYGHAFAPAIALSGPLLLAITPDFVAALLMTALTAWNQTRLVFAGTTLAAGINIVMNLLLIPRYGAIAAAYITPVSYGVLFAVLVVGMRRSEAGNS